MFSWNFEELTLLCEECDRTQTSTRNFHNPSISSTKSFWNTVISAYVIINWTKLFFVMLWHLKQNMKYLLEIIKISSCYSKIWKQRRLWLGRTSCVFGWISILRPHVPISSSPSSQTWFKVISLFQTQSIFFETFFCFFSPL